VDRRTLGYATAVVVVFALIVGGALALGGDDDDEPREAAAPPATTAEGSTSTEAERAETQAQPDDGRDGGATVEEPEAAPETEPAPAPTPAAEPARYVPFSASSGDWQAELPSGNGWQQPAERQLGGGRRLRVTVRGPDGAAVVIDHTPAAPARFGSKYRSSRELPQASVGSMTEYRLSDDAVGYVMGAGDGGFRVFATGVDGPVARRVADSLSFVDL
jgi:pyruvate/2-oxoglutarate dehydrogenase complex dihydrolipoamide acyltransferase (E2) component